MVAADPNSSNWRGQLVSRRVWLTGTLSVLPIWRGLVDDGVNHVKDVSPGFTAIERRRGGRLGVAILDSSTGRRLVHRGSERFAMCSTFKCLAAAAVLARVDSGHEQLNRFVPFGPGDLLDYAPITTQHVNDGGMTLEALLAAAIEYSDNTAANLLLANLGGPAALTHYVRRLGDRITRLDRNEPSLNVVNPGEVRDTTSPVAMLADMETLLLKTAALSPASRQQLTMWLVGNTTGDKKLRAGLPATWRIGDKTGTGPNGANNDIAIAWPPGRAPILIAAYFAGPRASADDRDQALADVGHLAATEFGS